jgi:gas vesicle protein
MARFSKAQAAGLFVTGVAAGAALALLYAPKTGAQTRRDLRKFSKRTLNRLDNLQDDIRDQVTDWVDDVSSTIRDGITTGKKLSSHGYDQVMEVFDNAKKSVEEGKTRLQRMIQTA